MLGKKLALVILVIGLVGNLAFCNEGFSSQPQVPSWESAVKVKPYSESLNTLFSFLCSKEKVVINDGLSMPAFNVTILTEPNLCQLTTGLNSNLSLLILLKQVNPQKTLVLTKSQVKPEYRVETVQRPKKVWVKPHYRKGTWVKGHYRSGTYVKGYYRKDGTYVRGHYRKGGWVKGHYRGGGRVKGYWRTIGTETVTRTIIKYPYDLTSELLNSSVFRILDSKYSTEEPDQETQSQMESLENTLEDLENTKEVEE